MLRFSMKMPYEKKLRIEYQTEKAQKKFFAFSVSLFSILWKTLMIQ